MIKSAADHTVLVDTTTVWIPIDENTPRGVKLQLISRASGVAQYGQLSRGDNFFTHWFPLPVFPKLPD